MNAMFTDRIFSQMSPVNLLASSRELNLLLRLGLDALQAARKHRLRHLA